MSKKDACKDEDLGLRALERRLQNGLDRIEKRPAYAQGSGPRPGQSGISIPEVPRNGLQTISDWWHGGATQGARSRHLRVNY